MLIKYTFGSKSQTLRMRYPFQSTGRPISHRNERSFRVYMILLTGFANFIDKWSPSHCDFCFTNFGVILDIWSQVSQRKKPFSDFPARGPGMYTLS